MIFGHLRTGGSAHSYSIIQIFQKALTNLFRIELQRESTHTQIQGTNYYA